MPGLNEADTQAKLVNPALYKRGWTEDHIKREETTGAVEIIAGKARRRSRGRTDMTLRVVVIQSKQPVALAVVEINSNRREKGLALPVRVVIGYDDARPEARVLGWKHAPKK